MKNNFFTLIELLVSIAIVAILATITVGGLSFASNKSAHDKTVALMEEFETALEEYKKDYGIYPVIDKDNPVKVDFSDSKWKYFTNYDPDKADFKNKKNRAYMEGNLTGEFKDAYDTPFYYEYPSKRNPQRFALWSCGKDEKHGKKSTSVSKAGEAGSDDICNWKQK